MVIYKIAEYISKLIRIKEIVVQSLDFLNKYWRILMRKAHDFIEKDLKRCYTVFRNLSGDSVQVDISIQNTVILFNSCEHKYFVHNSNNN